VSGSKPSLDQRVGERVTDADLVLEQAIRLASFELILVECSGDEVIEMRAGMASGCQPADFRRKRALPGMNLPPSGPFLLRDQSSHKAYGNRKFLIGKVAEKRLDFNGKWSTAVGAPGGPGSSR